MASLTEKVLEIMKDPTRIRNIGIIAHIHHGKCVSGDTIIYLVDKKVKAKDLFEYCAKKGILVKKDEYEIIYDVSHLNLYVYSYNKETDRIEKRKITHAWKLKGGEVLEIITNKGKIKTTPEHRFLVYTPYGIIEKQARFLREGDQILAVSIKEEDYEYSVGTLLTVSTAKVIQIRKTYEEWVYDFTVEKTHNFVANGFIIHNTTLTDTLLAGAGMLSEEVAGEAMFTWWHETERERELTVFGACVSMVHEYEGKEYLINLLDTPGHVDFSGEVTRACRAIDGAVVVVCAVDGVMPQTEAVLRQALKERVKPVLFINKVDRLITELKLTPEQVMQRIAKIINDVNALIRKYAPPEFKDKWMVKVQDGSVAFGSARDHWALSVPYMQKTGVKFQDIIKIYEEIQDKEERRRKLRQIAPCYKVVLDMIVRHLPSPVEAQKYRIPAIWHRDLNSEYGKALLNCDPNGPVHSPG